MKRILGITNSIINNKIFIEFITIEKNSKGAKWFEPNLGDMNKKTVY